MQKQRFSYTCLSLLAEWLALLTACFLPDLSLAIPIQASLPLLLLHDCLVPGSQHRLTLQSETCQVQTESAPWAHTGFGVRPESDPGTLAQHGPQGAAMASLPTDSSRGVFRGDVFSHGTYHIMTCCHSLLVKEAPIHSRPTSREPRGQISETVWPS